MNGPLVDFLSSLGHRLSLVSDDPRETSFLFQRLSVSIHRFNSVCLPAQFFTSRDASRINIVFSINVSAFGNEVSRAIYNNNIIIILV